MQKRILYLALTFLLLSTSVLADCFVPEFDKMQILRCDYEESIYNKDNSLITQNKKFRLYRLDDENKKIYLQKEPIDNILYYEQEKIEFNIQSMTDDAIIMSHTSIDRNTNQYSSSSVITYDNPSFGTRYSKSSGFCKVI